MASSSINSTAKTSTKTHYARLGHAAQNVIPKLMQELLHHFESQNNVYADCYRNRYLSYNLNQQEWIVVKNATKDGYTNFDIPLTYKILRNLNLIPPPSKGWSYPSYPLATETSIGDDVERFRWTRNVIIVHRGNTIVTDQELAEYFSIFKEIAERFEKVLNKHNKEFVSEFIDLESCCMDEETEKRYLLDLEIYQKQINQLEETVESLSLRSATEDDIQIVLPPEDLNCIEGEDIRFDCGVVGPNAEAKWYRNGQEVQPDRFQIESKNLTHALAIPNVSIGDSGHYTMTVRDKSCEFNLTVEGRKPCLVTLRAYQMELAKEALNGKNTIVCAGTNAGKTYVAYHVIENHLLKHKKGKVVFINRTNVLLQQQYERACGLFTDLNYQGKIYRWNAADEGECDPFSKIVKRVSFLFCTPQSLCNHLDDVAKDKISLSDFSLIVLDECHHVARKNPFNKIMNYYRQLKCGLKLDCLPQVVGLTASPGTNKATNESSAVNHLKTLMANMDVAKLSVVRDHEAELQKFTSTPTKVLVLSRKRKEDPVQGMLLEAIVRIEDVFSTRKVQEFLLENGFQTQILQEALRISPLDKTGKRYIQWMYETRAKIENIMLTGQVVPQLLHTCFRHLEVYVDCLEINSLLDVGEVRNIIKDAYVEYSHQSQNSNIPEEGILVEKLKDIFLRLVEVEKSVENNPDVNEIIKTLDEEYAKQGNDSRFLIFVKARATAKALAELLPGYLRALYLTGKASKDKSGLHLDQQLTVMEKFRDGECLCLVATSVACEGVDIPQCNLVIRYKFRVDEISSYQMRGRIRHKEGREVVLTHGEDYESEQQNVLRQYYMEKAIKHVLDFELSKHIAIAEKQLFDEEENERLIAQIKTNQRTRGEFSVNCKYCGKLITEGRFMRHIKKKNYIVIDKTMFGRISRTDVDRVKKFDAIKQIQKARGRECSHKWGSIIVYEECKFLALSKDYVTFFDAFSRNVVKCKKWADFPYAIDGISQQEISECLRDQF